MEQPHISWLPAGAELLEDVSPARWVEDVLAPWDRIGVRVESFVPNTFDAYARLVNPARMPATGREVRWAELGARHGLPLAPDATFAEVAGFDPDDHRTIDAHAPLDGQLPQPSVVELVGILGNHTASRSTCWFALWDGNGALYLSSHTSVSSETNPEVDLRHAAEVYRARATAQERYLNALPKVRIPNRDYFLVRGPLEAALAFVINGWTTSPNLWWPDDRAWFVSTEVDGYSTYVGGSRAAIDAVLASRELETVEVTARDRLDVSPFKPRWR